VSGIATSTFLKGAIVPSVEINTAQTRDAGVVYDSIFSVDRSLANNFSTYYSVPTGLLQEMTRLRRIAIILRGSVQSEVIHRSHWLSQVRRYCQHFAIQKAVNGLQSAALNAPEILLSENFPNAFCLSCKRTEITDERKVAKQASRAQTYCRICRFNRY
jgi:hypothetical protein